MRLITLIAAVALAVAAPAIAGKGGNGNGGENGGGSGSENGASSSNPKSYAPTLDVVWPLSAASDTSSNTPYVIEGCNYDASLGGVTVVVYTPVSAAWTGASPDGGCISVSNFSTQGPGTYRVEAWQHVRNKDVVVASTSFDV